MSGKHGRPISLESNDPATIRRREKTAERARRYHDRKRALREQTLPSSQAQLDQVSDIINVPSVERNEAVPTSLALGMRKSLDLEVPHDPIDAQLQQSGEDIDEHYSLYRARQERPTGAPSQQGTFPQSFFRRFATRGRPRSKPTNNDGSERNDSNVALPEPTQHIDDGYLIVDATDQDEARDVSNSVNLSSRSNDIVGEDQPQHQSDDDESHINFASERQVDETEYAACEYAANKLFEQLQGGHHGCSQEEHDEKLREHIEKEGDNHHGLSDIFYDRELPSVLGSEGLITPNQLSQLQLATPAQLQAIFCGIPATGDQHLPMNICLHTESTQAIEAGVAFDTDSFLGFFPSLAAAKNGLSYQPAPQTQQNIQSDIHIEMDVSTFYPGDDEVTWNAKKLLRDIPHCLLVTPCRGGTQHYSTCIVPSPASDGYKRAFRVHD